MLLTLSLKARKIVNQQSGNGTDYFKLSKIAMINNSSLKKKILFCHLFYGHKSVTDNSITLIINDDFQ